MNEELKNQLTQFLAKALNVAEKGIDTAGEQIPLVLQEIIQWQLWSSIGFIALSAAISAFGFACAYCLYRAHKRIESFDYLFGSVMVSLVALLVFLASLLFIVPTIIKVLTAPRLVIIEYLKGLL